MDQAAVVLGDTDAFVPMLCQPSQTYPLVRLPRNLKVWGIDSGVRQGDAPVCPGCGAVCRVPRGKGRIVITCPRCGNEIHGKS